MSDDILNEIREQLEAIRLVVQKAPRARVQKAKAPPRTAYGWFKRRWGDAEFRSMLIEHVPSIDDALENPVEVYKGLDKEEKALVRELFEAQRAEGQRDEIASDA